MPTGHKSPPQQKYSRGQSWPYNKIIGGLSPRGKSGFRSRVPPSINQSIKSINQQHFGPLNNCEETHMLRNDDKHARPLTDCYFIMTSYLTIYLCSSYSRYSLSGRWRDTPPWDTWWLMTERRSLMTSILTLNRTWRSWLTQAERRDYLRGSCRPTLAWSTLWSPS